MSSVEVNHPKLIPCRCGGVMVPHLIVDVPITTTRNRNPRRAIEGVLFECNQCNLTVEW